MLGVGHFTEEYLKFFVLVEKLLAGLVELLVVSPLVAQEFSKLFALLFAYLSLKERCQSGYEQEGEMPKGFGFFH